MCIVHVNHTFQTASECFVPLLTSKSYKKAPPPGLVHSILYVDCTRPGDVVVCKTFSQKWYQANTHKIQDLVKMDMQVKRSPWEPSKTLNNKTIWYRSLKKTIIKTMIILIKQLALFFKLFSILYVTIVGLFQNMDPIPPQP